MEAAGRTEPAKKKLTGRVLQLQKMRSSRPSVRFHQKPQPKPQQAQPKGRGTAVKRLLPARRPYVQVQAQAVEAASVKETPAAQTVESTKLCVNDARLAKKLQGRSIHPRNPRAEGGGYQGTAREVFK